MTPDNFNAMFGFYAFSPQMDLDAVGECYRSEFDEFPVQSSNLHDTPEVIDSGTEVQVGDWLTCFNPWKGPTSIYAVSVIRAADQSIEWQIVTKTVGIILADLSPMEFLNMC
jgi:hypothetical protein